MAFRQDVWTHDTCLVCQSMHSTADDKQQHESDETHKKKVVVYDFLSRELSCLTPSDRRSVLYERYYRANASIAGLDCICELNFSWSTVPLWACTICYVAGRTVESADAHMYCSFHKRNYICEYHPDRYAGLLRVQEKSSKDKQSLLEHEAIVDTLIDSQGLMAPDVYVLNERDQEWAFQKLGLIDEAVTADYITEDVTDNHRIALCYTCGESFMTFIKEDQFREAWFTHLSTKTHQRCKFLHTLIHEDKMELCEGVPDGVELRNEIKFQRHDDDVYHYGPTVGLEFLVMFTGSNESFCGLCYSTIPNSALTEHFSSEYHIERFVKRDGPSKLLNSQYLKVEEIHDILTYCLEENPVKTHKYFRSEKQMPFLLKKFAFPEQRLVIAYDLEQIDLGHDIKAIWCEDCKEYININEDDAWNIHIFEDSHFEQGAKKGLFYFDDDGLVHSNVKLDDFPRSHPPAWEEQFSVSLGILTTQDHCEFGLQFIIQDMLRKKLYCTCCFVECDEGDKQMFAYHARSLQHITRAMHSMNKKTMITLTWRFPDANSRKPLVMDYLLHYRLDAREQQTGISVYDPALACKLNCLCAIPKRLLDLARMAPSQRIRHIETNKEEGTLTMTLNNVLRLAKIEIKSIEKKTIIFCCEDCRQGFASSFDQILDNIAEHLLSTSHWERTKTFEENRFDENQRVLGKESKIKVSPYTQPNPKKKITWKWNDKKGCYEFVYAQLGLGDIRERRHFKDGKPDFFCTICAQSFKATKLDLENHIRSFSHIFHFMLNNRPMVISELQEQLTATGLTVVEKHKGIRRLFAKALKGSEQEKSKGIAIYDFEEKECEYADVKNALREDKANTELRQSAKQPKVPTQQRSLTNVTTSLVGEEVMNVIRMRNQRWKDGEELDKHLLKLIEQEQKQIEAEQQQQGSEAGKEDAETVPISLEMAKRQLLGVVHFDGMVQLEDNSSATQNTQNESVQQPPKDSSTETTKETGTENTSTSISGLTVIGQAIPVPIPPQQNTGHRSKTPSSTRSSVTKSDLRPSRDRHRSRSKERHHRQARSKSQARYDHRSRSPGRSKGSKSPPSKRSREHYTDEVARGKSLAHGSTSGRARTKSPPPKKRIRSRSRSKSTARERQPVVYTSAAKRLHDLKLALAQKESQKKELLMALAQREKEKQKKEMQRTEVPDRMFFPPPPSKKPPERPSGSRSELGSIPPPPHSGPSVPGNIYKKVGGAYDSDYLERACPQLLANQQSIPETELLNQTGCTSTSGTSMATDRNSNEVGNGSGSESVGEDEETSLDLETNEVERMKVKQQLMNRMVKQGQKNKYMKILMNIPKELPAFKQQAMIRQQAAGIRENSPFMVKNKKLLMLQQQAQKQQQEQRQRDRLEEERLQAISPEPEEIARDQQQQQQNKEQDPKEVLQQKQQIVLEKVSKWGLVGGKFVPVDPAVSLPTVTSTSSSASTPVGQPIPKIGVVEPPRLIVQSSPQQAQSVLNQLAASTAALTAQQMSAQVGQQQRLPTTSLVGTPNTSLAPIAIGGTPTDSNIPSLVHNQALPMQQQNLLAGSTMPTPMLAHHPMPTASLVPPLLGTIGPPLNVPPAMAFPPRFNQFPPFMGVPPMSHPPPMLDPAELIMRQKAQMYGQGLERVTNVAELIEFMWKRGYDPIPATDPPLLFNEVLNKRKGLVGASTLYQIICFGHPELETYYCGMCNHWTTVSEMFNHLRAPMHRLSYMFRNYKMYHRKAMEEQDEDRRDALLERFAAKIWEVEGCGRCTNRMRCILNEEAIRRIWPDYINCIDHSWKIMDEDEIEFLDSLPAHQSQYPVQQPKTQEFGKTIEQQATPMDMDTERPNSPPNPLLHVDQSQVRAQSAQVRAAIVAKKLELAERAGLPKMGLVSIKSEAKQPDEELNVGKEKKRKEKHSGDKDKESESSKESKRSSDRSGRKKERSKDRSKRSRSRSRRRSRSRKRGDREERDSRKGRSRQSRSKTPVTTKENGGKSTTWKDKGSKDKTVEGTEKGSGGSGERNWDERIAEFLHKIGDTENATKVYCGSTEKGKPPETANYWANLAMAKERSERDLAGKKTGRTTIAEATTTNVPSSSCTPSLADRLANSGSALLRRTQQHSGNDEQEMEQLRRQMASPERPKVIPLNQGKQQQQRPADDKSEMRKAIAAMVELQQEYENNNGYLSGEVYFHTCQEFGIMPEQAIKNRLLQETALELGVDIQAGFHAYMQRRQQQNQFSLQSMGVDTSKLKGLDNRTLQSILSKANTSNLPSSSLADVHPSTLLPRSSRLEPHDLALDESLAPSNYVYPSYEEETASHQQHPPTNIDSNISRLTYAFSDKGARRESGGAEVTLAVKASQGTGNRPAGRAVPGTLGSRQHPSQPFGRHPLDPRDEGRLPQTVPPDPRGAGGMAPPDPNRAGAAFAARGNYQQQAVQGRVSEADTQEQPMDLDFSNDEPISWHRGPNDNRSSATVGSSQQPPLSSTLTKSAASTPLRTPEAPFSPSHRHQRTPGPNNMPRSGWPAGWPRPHGTGPPHPMPRQTQPPTPQQSPARPAAHQPPQPQKGNPDLHRLAMEVGDDWNSLGSFSFEMFGFGAGGSDGPPPNPSNGGGNKSQQTMPPQAPKK